MEMLVNGVSARKVDRIARICRDLDPVVTAWRIHPLAAARYPVLLVDALGIKIRQGGHVRAQSGLVVTGVTATGYREILAREVGDSESATTWGAAFAGLKARGLTGVHLVVSARHAGLMATIAQHFQEATWQRCQTHCPPNILTEAPKAQRAAVGRALWGGG